MTEPSAATLKLYWLFQRSAWQPAANSFRGLVAAISGDPACETAEGRLMARLRR